MRLLIAQFFASPYVDGVLRYSLILAFCAIPVVDVYGFRLTESDDIRQYFDSVDLVWDDVESIRAGGVVIRTAAFRSSDSVDSLARKLTMTTAVFDRLLTTPGHRFLSGVKDGWHWLAQINASSSGAYGYVSVLQAASVPVFASPTWLPGHTSTLFSYSDSVGGKKVTQHVHRFSGTVSALRDHLYQRLIQQGWKRQTNHDTTVNTWQWYRHEEDLVVMMIPDKQGVLMFTQSTFNGERQ